MSNKSSFQTVLDWFAKAAMVASSQGRKDSAALWRDGREQLVAMEARLHWAYSKTMEKCVTPPQTFEEWCAAIDQELGR